MEPITAAALFGAGTAVGYVLGSRPPAEPHELPEVEP